MSHVPYTVKVDQGPGKGGSFDVRTEALVIGSGAEAEIRLEGPGVEPRHARVVFQGGRVILEDLSQESGTFRNGQRLLGPIQVFPGDRIGLGPEVVLVLEGDDPTQGAPTIEEQAQSAGLASEEEAEDTGGEDLGEAGLAPRVEP